MANYDFILSVTIRDEIGTRATLPLYLTVPEATTITQLHTYLQDWIAVIDPITDGQIVKAEWSSNMPFSGAKSAPVANGRVEQTGLFNFENSVTSYKAPVDIPAISNSTIAGGARKVIDLTNTGIVAFIAFMETVTLGITVTNKFVGALVALIDAAITFRKHRKQLTRETTEL